MLRSVTIPYEKGAKPKINGIEHLRECYSEI
jgi:hypothetical protein